MCARRGVLAARTFSDPSFFSVDKIGKVSNRCFETKGSAAHIVISSKYKTHVSPYTQTIRNVATAEKQHQKKYEKTGAAYVKNDPGGETNTPSGAGAV